MKICRAILLLGTIAIVVSGCFTEPPGPTPPSGKPDLVITTFQVTGVGGVDIDGNRRIPVRVVVENQGGTPADVFKVAVESTASNGTFLRPFDVPGQTSMWYPYTSGPLAAGNEVVFIGEVVLTNWASLSGETITLTATADSCAADEFMPVYCRVDESDETNNTKSTTYLVP